ncbi:L,D-transpeptidase family protein [Actinoplanes sp. NPDC026623]|uniref:L,D-transpeptidase n=1 Tax=Actinoplanes sp. NPDC026623 TaxID=3155610 RepID=UPI0033E760D8
MRWRWACLTVLAASALAVPVPSAGVWLRVPARPVVLTIPRAVPAPAGLPVIDYLTGPRGLPADSGPLSTTGLHPDRNVVVYDAPGGRPRAVLPPAIGGLQVVLPVVSRQSGWVAVLMPTANRRMGWLPPHGWSSRPLHDHLVVRRGAHELTWFRDGVRQAGWTVATGAKATPTPLGRTFVLGATGTRGSAYAGLDALVLGSVPEDRGAVAWSLRGAHTGVHGWYDENAFGRSVSNGCIRMPAAGQRKLLRNIAPGTPVTVVD